LAARTAVVASAPCAAVLPPRRGDRALLLCVPLACFLPLLVLAFVRPELTLSSCSAAGISTPAAKEGSCRGDGNGWEKGTDYSVVNAGHALHMPGYTVALVHTV